MRGREYSSIDEIMDDWKKEIENLNPMEIKKNTLDNSLNLKRLQIKAKYEKIIDVYMNKKHPK